MLLAAASLLDAVSRAREEDLPSQGLPSAPDDSMSRAAHQYQLTSLARQIVSVGRSVLENMDRATAAFIEHDPEAVPGVLAADDRVDVSTASLERDAIAVLALEAPKEKELAHVVSVLRLAYELERCGDLMVNVARLVTRFDTPFDHPAVRTALLDLATGSRELLANAIDIYASGVPLDLDEADDRVDSAHTILLSRLEESDLQPQGIVALTTAARSYERVADHAVNLARRASLAANPLSVQGRGLL